MRREPGQGCHGRATHRHGVTGTDVDHADIPADERPRPKDPAQPHGGQIGRLWNASTGKFVTGFTLGGAPIGSDEYVALWLEKATIEICSEIQQISTTLSSVDVSCAHAALTYSSCTKFDWICQTNKPSLTWPFAERVDAALLEAFEKVGTTLPTDNLDPSFTLDRMQLRLKDGGAGFRLPSTIVDHAFLNTMVMIGPILVGGPQQHQSGIAPGLAEALGADSFADSNRATRWSDFIVSGLSDSDEFKAAHGRLRVRATER